MIKLHNFYLLHLYSFTLLGLIGSFLLYFAEPEWSFIDSFFTSFSSVTDTGLTNVSLEQTRFISRIIIIMLFQIGSPIFWTIIPVIQRRRFLMKSFNHPIHPKNPSTYKSRILKPLPLYSFSIEYHAMSRLLIVLSVYIISLYLFGFLCLSLRFILSPSSRFIAEQAGGWKFFTIFHVISATTNCGLSLFNSSMTPFSNDPCILIPSMILIVLGQTGFPIALRVIIYQRSKRSRYGPVYSYLLEHGRSVYTHLFSSVETLYLLFWWIIFFIFQFSAILIFDYHHFPEEGLLHLLNAVFMTISTRVAGFSTIEISSVSPPMLIIYMLLHILAVTPFISVLRSSAETIKPSEEPKGFNSALRRFVSSQQSNPWVRDFFWVYFSWLVLTITVYKQFDGAFLFSLLFEVSSSYGNIGLSMGTGVPTEPSLAAVTGVFGKLVLCLVMIAGRHRDLPSSGYTLDRAVTTITFEGMAEEVLHLLPVKEMEKMEIGTPREKVKEVSVRSPLLVDSQRDEIELTMSRNYLDYPSIKSNRDNELVKLKSSINDLYM
ncbi:hypothetical protein GEMRC1_006355 [Eukaryota sp. GEM-RC1]